jgi:hypothetical protein
MHADKTRTANRAVPFGRNPSAISSSQRSLLHPPTTCSVRSRQSLHSKRPHPSRASSLEQHDRSHPQPSRPSRTRTPAVRRTASASRPSSRTWCARRGARSLHDIVPVGHALAGVGMDRPDRRRSGARAGARTGWALGSRGGACGERARGRPARVRGEARGEDVRGEHGGVEEDVGMGLGVEEAARVGEVERGGMRGRQRRRERGAAREVRAAGWSCGRGRRRSRGGRQQRIVPRAARSVARVWGFAFGGLGSRVGV